MSAKERLAEQGITLPQVVAPVAAYVPAVRTGNLVYTAGQLPFVDGKLPVTGKVGADVAPDAGKALARVCALNALAAIDSLVDLNSVTRVVKVVGFVASAPGFHGQPGSSTGPRNCWLRCSATTESTRARRSGWQSCRWVPRSRSN